MRKHLVALVMLFGCMVRVASGQRSSAARSLGDAFVHAWNTHDGPAFGRLYAAEANWVTVGGETHNRRAAIEGALAKEHAGWVRTTTHRTTDVVVRASILRRRS